MLYEVLKEYGIELYIVIEYGTSRLAGSARYAM